MIRLALVGVGEMFRASSDLETINKGTEYTINVAGARTSQIEAIQSDLRGMPSPSTFTTALIRRRLPVPHSIITYARNIEEGVSTTSGYPLSPTTRKNTRDPGSRTP
jgi:hypothetical protein